MGKASSTGLKIYVFLMLGVILSGIITVMYLTKSINLENFYDVGAVYDILDENYKLPGVNWLYDFEKKLIVTQAEDAYCTYSVKHSRKNWGFLYLDIRDLSADTPARIDFLGADGEVLYTVDFELQEGRNVLQLQEDDVYSFRFIVENPVSFAIQGMQFREREQEFSWSQAPPVFAAALICCFAAMGLLLFLFRLYARKRNFSNGNLWIGTLQECYIRILERCSLWFYGFTERKKSLLRQVLFFASLMLIFCSSSLGWTINITTQRRMVLTLGIFILCIAFLSWEGINRIPNWKNPLASAWFAICIMCIISDFIVPKNLRYFGFFMLGAMGPFYLAWNNMKKPERIIREFLSALRWFYWGVCVFCLFFRPFVPGTRYIGIYRNTNAFAGFLVTVNVVFLTWLDGNLGRERLKKRVLVENVFGLVTIWGFLMLTGSITSMVAYILGWIIFLWKQFLANKKGVYWRNLRNILLLSVVSLILVVTVGRWGVINVPHMMGAASTLHDGEEELATETSPFSIKVEAAENIGVSERVLGKLTSGEWYLLFTGRTVVWKSYIRALNLFGHSGFQECVDGKRMHAHNAVLQMMHYYGIFIVIPYTIMLYYSIKYGVMAIFHKKRVRMNLFFMLSSTNYVVQGLAEDIATPYAFISWLMFFIALGGMFNQQLEKTET